MKRGILLSKSPLLEQAHESSSVVIHASLIEHIAKEAFEDHAEGCEREYGAEVTH